MDRRREQQEAREGEGTGPRDPWLEQRDGARRHAQSERGEEGSRLEGDPLEPGEQGAVEGELGAEGSEGPEHAPGVGDQVGRVAERHHREHHGRDLPGPSQQQPRDEEHRHALGEDGEAEAQGGGRRPAPLPGPRSSDEEPAHEGIDVSAHRRGEGQWAPGIEDGVARGPAGRAQPAEQGQYDGDVEEQDRVAEAELAEAHGGGQGERPLGQRRIDRRQVGMSHLLEAGVAQRREGRVQRGQCVGAVAVELDSAFPQIAVKVVAEEVASEAEDRAQGQCDPEHGADAERRAAGEAEQPDAAGE